MTDRSKAVTEIIIIPVIRMADIREGKNAGLVSVGIIEGSSEMGLTEEEYQSLSEAERTERDETVIRAYREAGADYVIRHMGELLSLPIWDERVK